LDGGGVGLDKNIIPFVVVINYLVRVRRSSGDKFKIANRGRPVKAQALKYIIGIGPLYRAKTKRQ